MSTWVLTPHALTALLVGSDTASERLREAAVEHQLAMPQRTDTDCAVLLHRLVRQRRLGAEEAQRALALLAHAGIVRYHDHAYLARMWQLLPELDAARAACGALAEALGAELVLVQDLGSTPLKCATRLVTAGGSDNSHGR